MRVAALWVPDLPLLALRRSFPELAEAPLAVAAGHNPRDVLVSVSPEAESLGVRQGMTAAQGRQVAPQVRIRPMPQAELAAAAEALVEVARSFSPQVKEVEPGLVWLEVGGLRKRFGGEKELAQRLWQQCRRVGLQAHVGVATGGAVATVAARVGEVEVVPEGKEQEFLAPLPLRLLGLPETLQEKLFRWGIHTVGAWAALPREEVRRRLGEEGVRWHRLAWGEEEPFIPDPCPELLREGVWLEEPLVSLEACLFVLQGVLSRLRTRLALRGEGFRRLAVELALEGGKRRVYTVPLVAPTPEVPEVVSLCRLLLSASPPGAPVEGLAIHGEGGAVPMAQPSLFGPPQPAPGKLAAALVRLAAVVGPERVGRPEVVPTHRPSTWRLVPFALEEERKGLPPAPAEPLPALRLLNPPQLAAVTVVRGKPVAVRVAGKGGVVVGWAGPYRTEGGWWEESPYCRDDYHIATSDGAVWRVFFDHREGKWFADGIYD